MERAFGSLPLELFLVVLDQLVATSSGHPPIAYGPSDSVTKALRALTLVSRTSYLSASRYLYAHCLYLNTTTNYTQFRRTIGLDIGKTPLTLEYGEAGRNDDLFYEADIPRIITSAFISPEKTGPWGCGKVLMVRLPQIIDLGNRIGQTLKRLALDMQPVYTPGSQILSVKPHTATNNIFLHMPNLEDLICSYDVTDYFPHPPPNLKRLAMTFQGMDDLHLDFCFAISSLEILVCLRPEELQAADIDKLFDRYKGHHIDIVLVDVNAHHCTPPNTRDWEEEDRVKIWEVDVPRSYYGDDDELILCDSWIWTHGVNGTLWNQGKRRMLSWSEIQDRLADPEIADIDDGEELETDIMMHDSYPVLGDDLEH
ncbi:hypothetical protein P280DRAFT_472810 [Massarina eburnea CBS 473.64]|uniref:F-box domain-containing protein n=1 Tax=Massarina eburnea CBS 473.64 TaxID=1395130 RepID=A0A6A6RMQ7_9PLEO|nr:hypothetical protein P280DRAFT_472810 [Massarina eburnea CBS 473.64]